MGESRHDTETVTERLDAVLAGLDQGDGEVRFVRETVERILSRVEWYQSDYRPLAP